MAHPCSSPSSPATNLCRKVNYDEFMGRLIAAREPEESWTLERLFNEVDLNGLGYLSRADIEQLMQRPAVRAVLGNRSAKEVMKEMDTNSDGKISFDEFKFAMRGLWVEREGTASGAVLGLFLWR